MDIKNYKRTFANSPIHVKIRALRRENGLTLEEAGYGEYFETPDFSIEILGKRIASLEEQLESIKTQLSKLPNVVTLDRYPTEEEERAYADGTVLLIQPNTDENRPEN